MKQFAYKKLEDILQFSRGFDITKAQQTEGNNPVISSSGTSSYNGQYKCKGPGVITGRKGTLGKVFFTASNYWPHDTTLWVKNFKGNDPRYIYYLLTLLHFESFDVGASNPTLNRNHIHKIAVQFPDDLPTQQRIAGILSAYDELIEVNNQRIRLLEETAHQLYKEWFVRLRFPGHEQASFVKGLPEGWEAKKLGELASFINRGLSPAYDEKGFSTVLNQRCIRDGKIDFEPSRTQSKVVPANKLLKKGDILINSTGEGTLGRTAQLHRDYLNLTADSHVTIVRAKQGIFLAYLGLTVASLESHFESMAMGSTGQTELSRKVIFDVIVKVPNDSLLRRFSTYVTPINEQIETLQSQNTHLRQIRDRLLPRLISGKLSVGAVEREIASEPNLA